MTKIEKFEDVHTWQMARELVNMIYAISNMGNFSTDYGLREQIRRASGSVMHNIAEGFDAGTDPEFIRFLRYSLRSASEVQSQLYTASDQNYIDEESFQAA